MQLPLVIGRNSAGNEYFINLAVLPNLFISYNEEIQLTGAFMGLIRDLMNSKQPVKLAVSFGRKLAESLLPIIDGEKIEIQFTHVDGEDNKINTIDEFISSLIILSKNRKRVNKKSTNRCNHAIIVVLDNIFEVIMSTHKKTALSFIELLVNGPEQSIYCIAGSSGIYKNLLNQIINVSPVLKRKLQKSKHLKIDEPLAAELIINPDGLIFFKARNEKVFVRLFPN